MKNKLNFDDCEAMKRAIDQFESEDKENSKARKNDGEKFIVVIYCMP